MLVATGAFAQQPPAASTDGSVRANTPAGVGKIGIGTVGPSNLPADLRIKLEDAAAAGLTASGAQVVSAAELARARATAALGTCSDPVCERRLAQIADIRYWLRGTCQLDTSTYRLHLELVDTQSGAAVAARDDTCDICTEADAADLANVAASSLKATLTRSPTSLAPPALAPSPPPGGAVDVKIDDKTAGLNGNQRSTWRRVLPWVALTGATAALAGGVYAFTRDDGEGTCFSGGGVQCEKLYEQPAWRLGVPLIGIGAALATTGVILLRTPPAAAPGDRASSTGIWRSAAAPTRIVISPRGVAIAGRF